MHGCAQLYAQCTTEKISGGSSFQGFPALVSTDPASTDPVPEWLPSPDLFLTRLKLTFLNVHLATSETLFCWRVLCGCSSSGGAENQERNTAIRFFVRKSQQGLVGDRLVLFFRQPHGYMVAPRGARFPSNAVPSNATKTASTMFSVDLISLEVRLHQPTGHKFFLFASAQSAGKTGKDSGNWTVPFCTRLDTTF